MNRTGVSIKSVCFKTIFWPKYFIFEVLCARKVNYIKVTPKKVVWKLMKSISLRANFQKDLFEEFGPPPPLKKRGQRC